jgi:predicted nucleotidyltransferase component of viral defense system
MNKTRERNVAASVRARLLNHAKQTGQEFNLVLSRYAIERLLYRLSISSHADGFLLKGALLFDLWFDDPHRSTRDADLLGFGSAELPRIELIFKELCDMPQQDGIVFQSDSVRATEIRKEAHYDGVRVTLIGILDGARCHVQVDVGFGDAVTPAPEQVHYPVILDDFERPYLKVYPRYTVVAEKYEAICQLGMTNTRLKDYYDLWTLAKKSEFDGEILSQAIRSTFERRKTPLPVNTPLGLTSAFTEDASKQIGWAAFLRKNKLEGLALDQAVTMINALLTQPTSAARDRTIFAGVWQPDAGWQ